MISNKSSTFEENLSLKNELKKQEIKQQKEREKLQSQLDIISKRFDMMEQRNKSLIKQQNDQLSIIQDSEFSFTQGPQKGNFEFDSMRQTQELENELNGFNLFNYSKYSTPRGNVQTKKSVMSLGRRDKGGNHFDKYHRFSGIGLINNPGSNFKNESLASLGTVKERGHQSGKLKNSPNSFTQELTLLNYEPHTGKTRQTDSEEESQRKESQSSSSMVNLRKVQSKMTFGVPVNPDFETEYGEFNQKNGFQNESQNSLSLKPPTKQSSFHTGDQKGTNLRNFYHIKGSPPYELKEPTFTPLTDYKLERKGDFSVSQKSSRLRMGEDSQVQGSFQKGQHSDYLHKLQSPRSVISRGSRMSKNRNLKDILKKSIPHGTKIDETDPVMKLIHRQKINSQSHSRSQEGQGTPYSHSKSRSRGKKSTLMIRTDPKSNIFHGILKETLIKNGNNVTPRTNSSGLLSPQNLSMGKKIFHHSARNIGTSGLGKGNPINTQSVYVSKPHMYNSQVFNHDKITNSGPEYVNLSQLMPQTTQSARLLKKLGPIELSQVKEEPQNLISDNNETHLNELASKKQKFKLKKHKRSLETILRMELRLNNEYFQGGMKSLHSKFEKFVELNCQS